MCETVIGWRQRGGLIGKKWSDSFVKLAGPAKKTIDTKDRKEWKGCKR